MVAVKIQYEPETHAGELEDETLVEVWDHLYTDEEAPAIPEFTADVLDFFRSVNGVIPISLYANDIRIVRFLNLCNDYFPGNASIADWHIVRHRQRIADRLDPLVIPIAELAHGDYLCLDFSQGSDPSVVRWNHERSTVGKPRYHPVAQNLADFVNAINRQTTSV
jgi:hypothetical protein